MPAPRADQASPQPLDAAALEPRFSRPPHHDVALQQHLPWMRGRVGLSPAPSAYVLDVPRVVVAPREEPMTFKSLFAGAAVALATLAGAAGAQAQLYLQ